MKIRYLTATLLSLLSNNDAQATGTPTPPEGRDPASPPALLVRSPAARPALLRRSEEILWHLHPVPYPPAPPNTPVAEEHPPGGDHSQK